MVFESCLDLPELLLSIKRQLANSKIQTSHFGSAAFFSDRSNQILYPNGELGEAGFWSRWRIATQTSKQHILWSLYW